MPLSVDLSAIRFPSDLLTIRDIRQAFPFHLDKPRSVESGFASLDDIVGGVLDSERKLAEVVYNAKLGLPSSLSPYRESQRESLLHGYIELGIASGPQHAEQLIRSLESQAAEQAKTHSTQI